MIEVDKSSGRPHCDMGHDPKLIQIADLQHLKKDMALGGHQKDKEIKMKTPSHS